MSIFLKITIFLLGVVFVLSVVRLLVIRKINERNSILWLGGSLVILVLSASPDLLDTIAGKAGVDYPPTLLFLLSILVILFILLYQSIQISILQEKCKELAQHLAIVNNSMKVMPMDGQQVVGQNHAVDGREEVMHEGSTVRQIAGA